MKAEDLKKFNLEESVSGGLLDHLQRLDEAVIDQLDLDDDKDFLIHLKYSPNQGRYEFLIYKEN